MQGVPVSSYVYVGSENGTIYSSSSFDQEQIKQIAVQIQARDGGSPPLSTNVTVSIFILGQNDNAPLIIYPVAQKGFLAQQSVPFLFAGGTLGDQSDSCGRRLGAKLRALLQTAASHRPKPLQSFPIHWGDQNYPSSP